jgi:DNA-binding transcriptional regulator LsrR (DeoR family)
MPAMPVQRHVAMTGNGAARYPRGLMYAAAKLYYEDEIRQSEIARRLEVSPATVSRLLAEARRQRIVRIEVVPPQDSALDDLARRLEVALALESVAISDLPLAGRPGVALAPALRSLLLEVELKTGDALLISSGRTVYEAAQADLPELHGVQLAPMVGGQDEPEVWYATNEVTRQISAKVRGVPNFLYAPALPAPGARKSLLNDPSIRRVLELWRAARCAIVGIGAPPALRTSLPRFVPVDAVQGAVGDICTRFFDREGAPVRFPGEERLIAVDFDALRRIPACIAVAAGPQKVAGILAAARTGLFNRLATDADTAAGLLAAAAPLDVTRSS